MKSRHGQRLRDAVTETRAHLETYADRLTLTPDARHEEAFSRYSLALRALVAHHLSADNWSVATDPRDAVRPWRWDGYDRVFCFDYAGHSELSREVKLGRRRRLMWHRVAMELNPEEDLDMEILRLTGEAKIYQDAAELMEREWFLAHATEAT